jgi:hypothetical protein
MKSRHLLLAAIAAATLLPSISTAAGDKDAANACARAFAASIAAPGTVAAPYKLSFRTPSLSLAPYGRSATFNLQAQSAKTGAVLARAICFTNRDGSVTAVSAVPLDARIAFSDAF